MFIYDCTVPDDVRAIEVLKISGVGVPYPGPINMKLICVESIKDDMPPWQFKCIITGIL